MYDLITGWSCRDANGSYGSKPSSHIANGHAVSPRRSGSWHSRAYQVTHEVSGSGGSNLFNVRYTNVVWYSGMAYLYSEAWRAFTDRSTQYLKVLATSCISIRVGWFWHHEYSLYLILWLPFLGMRQNSRNIQYLSQGINLSLCPGRNYKGKILTMVSNFCHNRW